MHNNANIFYKRLISSKRFNKLPLNKGNNKLKSFPMRYILTHKFLVVIQSCTCQIASDEALKQPRPEISI
ncbi:hypothetical protein T01_13129 [Trichinella spiralis]|uniref:Uncharacterized protein n=1 Tax=Trichinella spiralis TaxID=6334 RepID=A0A0V1BG64_TRISP|nr:hypothetical protein T01_13129 [Trichinella spiralis]